MGLTELKIGFSEAKRKAIEGASVGVALILIKETSIMGIKEYSSYDEVTESYKADNKKYINEMFIGNVQDVRVGGALEERAYKPSKVIVCSIAKTYTLEKALEELENYEFNYMCYPEAEDGTDTPKLIAFIKMLKETGVSASLVLSTTTTPNNSDVINVSCEDITEGSATYNASKLLPFVTGLCAGTPLTQSITYANVPILTNANKKTNEEFSSLIDAGKVVFVKKMGKVKVARGVTSLTAPEGNEGDSFKKIKLVRTYKLIDNTIKKVITNYYLGKVQNTYDNKILLISEIGNYLNELSREGLIEKGYKVDIDIDEHKKYLHGKAIDYKGLTEQQLREANTGSKVYIQIALRGVDAMEDFYIKVNV